MNRRVSFRGTPLVFAKNLRRYNAVAAPAVPPWGWGAGAANRGVPGCCRGLATQATTQAPRKAAPLLASQRIKNPSAYLVGALPGQSWGFLVGDPGVILGLCLALFLVWACGVVSYFFPSTTTSSGSPAVTPQAIALCCHPRKRLDILSTSA